MNEFMYTHLHDRLIAIGVEGKEKGMDGLLDPKGLAAMLKIPVSQVYRLTQKGELPHIRVGKYLRYDPEEIIEQLHRGVHCDL